MRHLRIRAPAGAAPADGQRPVTRRTTSTISTCWRRFLRFRARTSSRPTQAHFAYRDGDQPSLGSNARRLLAPVVRWRGCCRRPRSSRANARSTSAAAPATARRSLAHLGAKVDGAGIGPWRVAAAREALAGAPGIEIVEGDLADRRAGKGAVRRHRHRGRLRDRAEGAAGRTRRRRPSGRHRRRLASPVGGADRAPGGGVSRRALFETRATDARSVSPHRRISHFNRGKVNALASARTCNRASRSTGVACLRRSAEILGRFRGQIGA